MEGCRNVVVAVGVELEVVWQKIVEVVLVAELTIVKKYAVVFAYQYHFPVVFAAVVAALCLATVVVRLLVAGEYFLRRTFVVVVARLPTQLGTEGYLQRKVVAVVVIQTEVAVVAVAVVAAAKMIFVLIFKLNVSIFHSFSLSLPPIHFMPSGLSPTNIFIIIPYLF